MISRRRPIRPLHFPHANSQEEAPDQEAAAPRDQHGRGDPQALNRWLDNHRNHHIHFVRSRWPLPQRGDAEGFPLPETAGIKDPVIMTSLQCRDCNRGIKVAVDDDFGQDITK